MLSYLLSALESIGNAIVWYFCCIREIILIPVFISKEIYLYLFPPRTRASNFSGYRVSRGDYFIDDFLDYVVDEDSLADAFYAKLKKVVDFNKELLIVDVKGEATMFLRNISGLRRLHLPRICTLIRNGDKIKVRATLGAKIIGFHYTCTAQFMIIGPSITVKGIVNYIALDMEFTMDADTGRNGVLQKFSAEPMRGMNVVVDGLGIFNWPSSFFFGAVLSRFENVMDSILDRKVKEYVGKKMKEYQFPVSDEANPIPDVE